MSYAHSPYCRRAALAAAVVGVLAWNGVAAQTGGNRQDRAQTAKQAAGAELLNPTHPDRYVVKKGDTLWDIAAKFLRDPWYWPEIWQVNPKIENPHLIYPGDVLSLAYVGGRPVIRLERGPSTASSNLTVKLSPRVRAEPLKQAIPTIPYETIRAFLNHPRVLDAKATKSLPYIVAIREGLVAGAHSDVYVRGTDKPSASKIYSVVHVGDPLIDPDDGTVVGYASAYVGQGQLTRLGDPATLRLTETEQEARVGDLLVQPEAQVSMDFLPHAPHRPIQGQIIHAVTGASLIGQYEVVVINRGSRDGLERGAVLRAIKTGEVVPDTVRGGRSSSKKVKLPDQPEGVMMVFRVYDRISYALVMEATRAISVHDTVRNP